MKKKTKKIIALVFAILLVILVQAMGITYAKYIASDKGNGQAEIAKWAFEIVKDGEQTKTVQLVNSANKDTLLNGKIAPGTSGNIVLVIDGTGSEVDMDYSIKIINEQNKPNNIIFIYGNQITNSLSDISMSGHIEHDYSQRKEISISWQWKYETGITAEEISRNDIIDTQDANTLGDYTFDIVVTATQSK